MPQPIDIQSRKRFAEVLKRAQRRTEALLTQAPDWELPRQIRAQLDFMAEATADGLLPTPTKRERPSLGLLAVRELSDTEPDFAKDLIGLNYVFARYQQLAPWEIMESDRHGILQVWSGRQAFHKIILKPGETRTVGSGDNADETIRDPELAPVHFSVSWDGLMGQILDCSGGPPMLLKGKRGWSAELGNRDEMMAGKTVFRFLVEAWTPPEELPEEKPGLQQALKTLGEPAREGTLFAVFDAARTPRILTLLEESVDPYISLYDGEKGRELDEVAPYLVRSTSDFRGFQRILREGWGEAWGIFPVSSAELLVVRRHFRQFLKVLLDDEAYKKPVYFRFYDPRVLGTFFEIASPDQRLQLMNGIRTIYHERENQIIAHA